MHICTFSIYPKNSKNCTFSSQQFDSYKFLKFYDFYNVLWCLFTHPCDKYLHDNPLMQPCFFFFWSWKRI